MKKVLCIAVHPDDETLGCGGTLLRHRELGDQVHWLILTSVSGHPFAYTGQQARRRSEEIESVARQYRFTSTRQLPFHCALITENDLRELVVKMDEVLNELQPQVIYINNRSDVHSDHRICFQAVASSVKHFRKPFVEKVLMYETLSETEFAPALGENAFIPNVFVDVSPYLEKKLDIMSLYASEVMPGNGPRSLGALQALAQFRGSRIGVQYAEAFMLLFENYLQT